MRLLGNSQHTVQYIEDFRDKEFVYIVMSYEGETNMAEFLKKNRLLSVNQFGFFVLSEYIYYCLVPSLYTVSVQLKQHQSRVPLHQHYKTIFFN